jgi:hypothetical protein
MTRLPRLAMLILAIGACNSDRARSDRAAGEVVQKRDELGRVIDDTSAPTRELDQRSTELAKAKLAFEGTRAVRLFGLRSERAMIAASPDMLETLAEHLPLTAASRRDVLARVATLRQRLDEVATQIDELQNATVARWPERDAAAAAAMQRLETARDEAWSSLRRAHRTDRSS